MKTIYALFGLNEDKAIECLEENGNDIPEADDGSIDVTATYMLNHECGWLEDSGLYLCDTFTPERKDDTKEEAVYRQYKVYLADFVFNNTELGVSPLSFEDWEKQNISTNVENAVEDKDDDTWPLEWCGENLHLLPCLDLYEVPDFMGNPGLGICLFMEDADDENRTQFDTATICLGEFIGQKYAAYIDTNNPASKAIADMMVEHGVARITNITMRSGFCVYPLYQFDPEWLKSLDESMFKEYSERYDELMAYDGPDEHEDEEPLPVVHNGMTLNKIVENGFERYKDDVRVRGRIAAEYETGFRELMEEAAPWFATHPINIWRTDFERWLRVETTRDQYLTAEEKEAWEILTGFAKFGKIVVSRDL